MMSKLLSVLMVSIFFFACDMTGDNENGTGESQAGIHKNDTNKHSTGNQKLFPKNAQEALDAIIPVLHAPYAKGDYFIKLITKKQVDIVKNGTEATIGKGTHTGSGKYSIIVGANSLTARNAFGHTEKGSIEYKYEKYQPKGSDIAIDGTINCTEWYKQNGGDNGYDMQFKGIFNDTLKISGAFDAELLFFGDYGSNAHTMIKAMINGKADTYLNDILIQSFSNQVKGNTGNGSKSRIELKYKNEILKLNENQMKKLLKVS